MCLALLQPLRWNEESREKRRVGRERWERWERQMLLETTMRKYQLNLGSEPSLQKKEEDDEMALLVLRLYAYYYTHGVS